MMFTRALKICLMVLLTAGLSATVIGCGDDEPSQTSNNNDPGNNDPGNNEPGNNEPGNNEPGNNEPGNNEPGNNEPGNNDPGNNDPGEPVPTNPSCDDAEQPERCTADPEDFTFSTASVISAFAINSDFTGGDPGCCFDFNGDGVPDNALGEALLDFDFLDTANDSIGDAIADGQFVVVLEHDGLDALADGDFDINFFLGKYDGINTIDPAGDNAVLIDPASIDAGTHPLAMLPQAKLVGDTVTAGPGTVVIKLELFDIPMSLAIRGARIEAQVDTEASSLETGVALNNGKIGGYVKLDDVLSTIDDVAATCECLGSPENATATCAFAQNTCEADSVCSYIGEYCSMIPLVSVFTDIDSDGDGIDDAISIGANFQAAGAVINGVAAAE